MNWERFFNGLASRDGGLHALVGLAVVLAIGWPLTAAGVRAADLWLALVVIVALGVREWVQAQYKAGGPRMWAAALALVNWGEAAAVVAGAFAAVVVGRLLVY